MTMNEAGGRLLVIDDDADSVEFFCEVGELAGLSVVGLTDPQRLDTALDPTPDIIILDLVMPGVDGIEIIRELHQRKCPSGIVLVSGHDRRLLAAAAAMATRLGLDVRGELVKPVSVEQLTAVLQQEGNVKRSSKPDYVPEADELRRAVAENQFEVDYQPQVSLADGRWLGVEALVRWNHPTQGRLSPALFIGLIEKLDLGPALTTCVLERAIEDMPTLRDSGFDGTLFVNLPAVALIDVALTDQLIDRLDAAKIPHEMIGFEVTETSLARDRAVAIDILARLRLKGSRLAIDDFGTGHATLEMLHELPFSELKIDLSFVRRADIDPVARTIVENSIKLGRELGLTVVAEGVETASLRDWLKAQGCDIAQGYFVCRPMPVAAMADWHAAWQKIVADEGVAAAAALAGTATSGGSDGFIDFDAPAGGDTFFDFDAPAAATVDDTAGSDGEARFPVFVVDDEAMIHELISAVLEDECTIECFASGAACLERLKTAKPALILCDVAMPGMNGYDFCQRIKGNPATADVPVIFISGEDGTTARVDGFEAGGEDFILKPFEAVELKRKVSVARKAHHQRIALQDQAGYAQRTAFAAMSSMGELGVVIEFLRRSFACNSASELAEAILGAVAQYGLSATTQILFGSENYTLGPQGENVPLEVSVLTHLRTQGRIFEFKNRSVYNYGAVSVVINDMPLDDPERCGRIRDNLAILAEGAAARVEAIELEQKNRSKESGIAVVLQRMQGTLAQLRKDQRQQSFQNVGLINELQQELIKSFVHLGLTDGQERFLADLIQQYMERMLQQNQQGDQIAVELETMAAAMARIGKG